MSVNCLYEGEIYGVLRVAGWSSVTYRCKRATLTKLRCECTRCGAMSVLTKADLVRLERRGARQCDACESRGYGDSLARPTKRVCVHCCDLPHRRPRVGLCHGCGKAFREDQIGQVV